MEPSSSFSIVTVTIKPINEIKREKNTSPQPVKRGIQRCRGCLGQASIPILPDNNSTTSDILKAMVIIANVKIDAQDGFPKFLCRRCYSLLRGAILFRKSAQQSDRILRNMKATSFSDSNSININEDDINLKKLSASSVKAKIKKEKVEPRDDNTVSCPLCNETLTTYEYADHMSNHKKPDIPIEVECTECKKKMKKGSLKQHMIAIHSGIKYICEICGKTCRALSNYKTHLLTHTDEFPYKCPHCPYKGSGPSLLKVHMRQHTKDYRYICSECPARFLTNSNFRRHMLRHKEPEYLCETCNRAFYTKLSMEKHINVDHLGIRNHVCNICNAAFGYRKAMMKHQLKVHKRKKLASGRMPAYLKAEETRDSQN